MSIRRDAIRAATMAAVATLFLASNSLAQSTVTCTEAEQQQLMLTVYNSNLALVKDVRRVQLPAGKTDLRFEGVAPQIEPESVQVFSETAPKDLSVLQQDYRYDPLSPQKLLHEYVGKQLTIIWYGMENNSNKEIRIPVTLVSDTGGPIWKVGDHYVTQFFVDHYVFPSLPENPYRKPTLVWLVENRARGPQTLEADYLTKSVNWTAEYNLTLPARKDAADLSAWVTVTNSSGKTFKNAGLQLVAGQVHRATRAVRPMVHMARQAVAVGGGVMQQVTEQPLSEYHLYTVHQKVTLPKGHSKQIRFLESSGIKFQKTYEVNGQSSYYYSPLRGGEAVEEPVETHIKFKNSEANALGVPLPAGVVRAYQSDLNGNLELVGEDRITHTPKDETVNLYIGNAFDVTAKRKQTDFETLGKNLYEAAFQITLRNHKTEPIAVEVNEPFGGQWTILKSSYPFEKTSAFSARFKVPVPAGGESVLTYRVRVQR